MTAQALIGSCIKNSIFVQSHKLIRDALHRELILPKVAHRMPQNKNNVVTEILLFDFELFIDGRFL
jgi:hypothetical protein